MDRQMHGRTASETQHRMNTARQPRRRRETDAVEFFTSPSSLSKQPIP
jgi:hypothetical protein